jgi:hypothetical protein
MPVSTSDSVSVGVSVGVSEGPAGSHLNRARPRSRARSRSWMVASLKQTGLKKGEPDENEHDCDYFWG